MDPAKEIVEAIAAHSLWKARLNDMIEKGVSEIAVPEIRRDDVCKFGTWLHGPTLAARDRASLEYKAVAAAHAEFHVAAAEVAALALAGKGAEAKAAMGLRSAFATASARLTNAMKNWKAALTD